jgi:hypothetical protein
MRATEFVQYGAELDDSMQLGVERNIEALLYAASHEVCRLMVCELRKSGKHDCVECRQSSLAREGDVIWNLASRGRDGLV